jgi:hypothetical protein
MADPWEDSPLGFSPQSSRGCMGVCLAVAGGAIFWIAFIVVWLT